ncbi:Histidine kinase-, DNA gyrase B-, and HSP90-like ATPase [Flavobacterium succinicans]|jgi:signal transduction histidine kinase|uniref:histidine kinase n=1 Tax=Flavobacterium succinicans TaxID=29536 RepID=A0A1I4SNQ9_9FLAO|nr:MULTISPECIES: ATP-binding protein [Flavobacterium]OOV29379.1 sensor histidine kinase [Flavobacterium sp. LM5]SFM66148.1 Histidine kinase-, DNA gyrase B-, and HSP90-like ATPase [Flavobacterium succinicans]
MTSASISEKEIVLVILYTSFFFMILAGIIIVFFYFSRKKIIQKEIEKKDTEIAHQKKLLKAVIETQETERKRIAQDLHDDISSKLNVVALNAHLLTTPNLSAIELEEIKTNVITLTGKALENSRKIAHDLLPPVLEKFGLDAGVEELCMDFSSTKGVQVEYTNEVTFEESDIRRQLHVFRILQELLNNSIRHGKATKMTISFRPDGQYVKCLYTDNGIGFDESCEEHQKGLGLKNIESRVSFLNGSLSFHSEVNKGVTVEIIF